MITNGNMTLAAKMVGLDVHHPTFGTGKVTMCTNVGLTVDDPELQKQIVAFYDSGDWTNPIHNRCEETAVPKENK